MSWQMLNVYCMYDEMFLQTDNYVFLVLILYSGKSPI